MQGLRAFSMLLILLLISGCAATSVSGPEANSARQWLLGGEALFGGPAPAVALAEAEVLSLDPSMEQFAERATAGWGTHRGKVTALIKAVIDPAGLNLQYKPTASFTARETFSHRRANCLSFTLMMVAMLRHLGVDARFNDVDVPLIWDIHDETTLLFYKHINSIVDFTWEGRAVMDLNMDEYDVSYEQRLISDEAAIAQYYNNRAMELLQQGDLRAAFPYLAKAISLEPRQSYLWNNLGSLYQRAGKLQAAKAAFEVALKERGSGAVVMSNAARLYAVLGDSKRAAELTRRVAAFRDANPYFRYVRAISAFRESDYETARDEAVAAIRLYKIEHRFHFLLGAIYEKLGLHEQAVKSVNTALSLTTDEKQLARYRNKLDRLFSAHL